MGSRLRQEDEHPAYALLLSMAHLPTSYKAGENKTMKNSS